MGGPSGAGISTGDIINLGKTAWGIVKDGRPTSESKSAYCNAVPKTIPISEIRGWRRNTGSWTFNVLNGWGMDAVTCRFHLDYEFAGCTEDMPDAKFLTNVRVTVGSCSVAWGAQFGADATLAGRPTFSGGAESPVSRLSLNVVCRLNNEINSIVYTYRLNIDGTGRWDGRGG
ncbi:hypothetical protein Z945_81 [Sulfitobacter noctilucae]|uniref:hypothetical protein n=1 Tax=Sulfitobacter noctilucae TaxID=1342302 RepID=UPI00046A4D54|nr:hypothetical protein [Sulfitobacter noctilucae]KIN75252.1 hypothetical protein Z945_81 [Sulfitobacter noctilucae]